MLDLDLKEEQHLLHHLETNKMILRGKLSKDVYANVIEEINHMSDVFNNNDHFHKEKKCLYHSCIPFQLDTQFRCKQHIFP